MSEINKPIDIDTLPVDKQLVFWRTCTLNMAEDLRDLHALLEKLYDSNEDIGLDAMLLEGLAITREYLPIADSAPPSQADHSARDATDAGSDAR